MVSVSEVKTDIPSTFESPLQEKVYKTLAELNISYERVDTKEVVTMEDCKLVDERLDVKVVKTLFLCNRQETNFYLFVTTGDKPFKTKDFSSAMGISRVSFAPSKYMAGKVGTVIGSTTIFSALLDTAKDVEIVIDKDVLDEEYYGCTDGTLDCYMKIETSKVINDILKHANKSHKIIEV